MKIGVSRNSVKHNSENAYFINEYRYDYSGDHNSFIDAYIRKNPLISQGTSMIRHNNSKSLVQLALFPRQAISHTILMKIVHASKAVRDFVPGQGAQVKA